MSWIVIRGVGQGSTGGLDGSQPHDLWTESADTCRDDARQRGETELSRTLVTHDHHSSRAIVQRAAVAGRDRAIRPEGGLQCRDRLDGCAWSRPVVSAHHGAVGQRDRCDFGVEDLVRNGFLGQVLRAHAEFVLLGAGDAAEGGEVFCRLAHRDVDVGHDSVLAGIMPLLVAGGGGEAALFGGGKDRIVSVDRVDAGGAEAAIPRDALHSGGDEGMALARLDCMEGDPGGLHAGCAEAIDRGGWDTIQSELDSDATRDIAALFVTRLGAADIDIVQRSRVQCRDLGKCGADHSGCKIIRTNVFERSLASAPDRRTRGRHDDRLNRSAAQTGGLRTCDITLRHHDHNPRSRPMSSFMISFDPAQILDARASAQARATRYSFMYP